ncbi:Os07g0452801 [Oryza sativa Japonica Group]|uniref:Os07g0452801 protein n=2 Tax=Oryza sativa subsp. japonica TaxID=39947 RepID=C7J4L0_ORYSJ|nr:hypothetical protein EE612_038959 [Oryza sativa]BAH93909.1 Os07g0452801 [Oryza sativa Japonica Group]BAT01325.1 Os07g0452801 [Oryza sativa Japonica Group]|eukprot:NP_001175181.1 Os07g0452801 [Oryza sativa Japonica Group]
MPAFLHLCNCLLPRKCVQTSWWSSRKCRPFHITKLKTGEDICMLSPFGIFNVSALCIIYVACLICLNMILKISFSFIFDIS